MSRGGYRRKDVPPDVALAIYKTLVARQLGVSKPTGGATWRLRVGDTDLGYWQSTGTLYGPQSRSADPAVLEAWRLIASLTPQPYVAPSRPLLVGLDEAGPRNRSDRPSWWLRSFPPHWREGCGRSLSLQIRSGSTTPRPTGRGWWTS